MSADRIDYGTAVPLSSGGMAEVYRAYDARLGRPVALKFLRREDPEQVERLLREARALAHLPTHENLCAIYGVGEQEGRPYIAMELIEGEALDEIGEQLTLRERVEVVMQIAAALEPVHDAGLIHRDIKPTNIVLARRADGSLRPVLVDFGVVWTPREATLTGLGQWLGTPAFMAPEQVVGGHASLGPPTDVYGLGGTLYFLLTGRQPFEGESHLNLLRQVLGDAPTPPRRHAPDVAPDLETIVLRCLRKDSGSRYPSGGALAEDLRRHLADEPLARATSQQRTWDARLLRRVRRWRTPLHAIALALVVTIVLLAVLAYRAQARRDAVQRYDRVGTSIEGTLRAVAMSAPHDVRAARAQVRARLHALTAELDTLSGPARAPLRAAIGRGWLALRDDARAAAHLRAAWQGGHRTATVAYGRGLALGRGYERAVRRASRLGNADARAAARAQADQRYRDAARDLLMQGRATALAAPAYVEGLIQFYEGDYATALASAQRARGLLPWLYEATELVGRIEYARALDAFNRGDFNAAWRALRAADRAYRAASASAPSDLGVALGACLVRLESLANGIDHVGTSSEASLPSLIAYRDAARVACRRIPRLDPDSAEA
ncbi:MAG: serine/threonine-protein kinase, partial [Acidobacteriota bacterium]